MGVAAQAKARARTASAAHCLGGGSDAAESEAAAAESGAYEEVCGAWCAEVQECPCELLRISSLHPASALRRTSRRALLSASLKVSRRARRLTTG